MRHSGLRLAVATLLMSLAQPVSADLYSMFVMSIEFVTDSSDVIVIADAVPHGQNFELRQATVLRNLTDEEIPWPIHGSDLLTDRLYEGHLKTIPVLLFARIDDKFQRLRLFHHVWLQAPDESHLALPIDQLIHCMPNCDSGAHFRSCRWPVCLAVDGHRHLLTEPDEVLKIVRHRIELKSQAPRLNWTFPRDDWHTFGYHNYEDALWMSAMEFDGNDTSWNILLPNDDTTKQLIASELDAGINRYGRFHYLKQFTDEPAILNRIRRGLRAKESWIRWEAREVINELGVPTRVTAPTISFAALCMTALGIAVLSAGLSCAHRWTDVSPFPCRPERFRQ